MVVLAMMGKMPLGTTCRKRIDRRLSPMASAERTKVRCRRLMACARMSFALPTQLVRPMTTMTLNRPLPNSATTMSTRKNVGIIMNTLISSPRIASVTPPK